MFGWCCVTSFYKKSYIHVSCILHYTQYTVVFMYSMMIEVFLTSDQFSAVMKWKTKPGTWHRCLRTPCDLVSWGQTCDLRRETPVEKSPVPRAATPQAPWRWLFPPTSPRPTLPRGSGWKPNMQILPVQTGWGTDIQIMTLLLSFLSFSLWSLHMLYIYYSWIRWCWFNFWHSDPLTPSPPHTPPPSLSLTLQFFSPPCQQANHRGMLKYHWLHPPPTHPQAHSAFGYPLSSFHTLSH